MKKKFVVAVTVFAIWLSLGISGCAGLKPVPAPEGCESALSYKIPGFLPLGPVLVRTGCYTLAVMVPDSRSAIKKSVSAAKVAIEAGDLVSAGKELAELFLMPMIPRDIALVIYPALENILSMQLFMNVAQSTTINECDKNIWLSLCNNVLNDLADLRVIDGGGPLTLVH